MVRARLLRPTLFLALAFAFIQSTPAVGQQKKTNCTKPPEVLPRPKQSKEDKQKQPKINVRGTVAIEISEDGQVVDAKTIRPSSSEAADQLVSLAKSMKFKPRPGCGVFKIVVNYVIGY